MKNRVLCLLTALAVLFTLPAQALGIWKCAEDGRLNATDVCRECGKSREDAEIEHVHPAVHIPKAGDHYTFGHYEQDNDLTNGAEPIDWVVLEVQQDRMLLLSAQVLVPVQFTNRNDGTGWAGSTLRYYLNNRFIYAAFNEKERACIAEAEVNNGGTQSYQGPYNGFTVSPMKTENTTDRIFLLSCKEWNDYKAKLGTMPTEYSAYSVRTLANENNKVGQEYLRSMSTLHVFYYTNAINKNNPEKGPDIGT